MRSFFEKLNELQTKNDKVYVDLIKIWNELTTEQREYILAAQPKRLERSIKKTKNDFLKKYNIRIEYNTSLT
jgi:hypothetical protein